VTEHALGVYVHFPFCRRRCPYCDFPTQACQDIPHADYLAAVLRELDQQAPRFAGFPLASIYFGGGTPSLWDPAAVARVIQAVRERFPVGPAGPPPEVTLELNPADVTVATLDRLATAGVNRASLGVQSFQDRTLRTLGRRHGAAEARTALARLRLSAIPRLSFDLICGVPGQDEQSWGLDLDEALGWERGHVSVYTLSLEPGTPMGVQAAAGELVLPDDEQVLTMLRLVRRKFAEKGLLCYEISNYARPGDEARHNLLTWRGLPYLGLGAGAHSHLPGPGPGEATRWANACLVESYLSSPQPPRAFEERLSPPETARERLLCRLRLAEGLDLAEHRAHGGADLVVAAGPALRRLEQAGLVQLTEGRLRLTEAGFEVADAVIRLLAP